MKSYFISEICKVLFIILQFFGGVQLNVAMDTLLVPNVNQERPNCECGKLTRRLETERIGKAKIPNGRIPWLAQLLLGDEGYRETFNEVEENYRLCFGVLVTLQAVLLPASCIEMAPSRTKLMVKLFGIENRKESILQVTKIRIYPGYRGKYDNDLALAILSDPVDFNRTKVVPVCLPEVKRKFYPYYPPHMLLNRVAAAGIQEVEKFDHIPPGNSSEVEGETRTKPCRIPNPNSKAKLPYILENSVTRTWFYRRGPSYDYIQRLGMFQTQKVNESVCYSLFPEMLKSKVECVLQTEIREVAKHKNDFFLKMELGMPIMLANTTLVKNKPNPKSTKYTLRSIRSPGKSGIPLLEAREAALSLLKLDDYVPWIRDNSEDHHFCKS